MAEERKSGSKPKNKDAVSRFKIVIVAIKDPKSIYPLAKLLSQDLSIPFGEAQTLLQNLPHEILSAAPEMAAEIMAAKLKKGGATVEVLPSAETGKQFCDQHPHLEAKGRCKDCEAYICADCILKVGRKLLCRSCSEDRKKAQRFTVIKWLVLAAVLAISIPYAFDRKFNKIAHMSGQQTIKVLLVELTPPPLDDATTKFFTRINQTAPVDSFENVELHGLPDLATWFQSEFLRLTYSQNITLLTVNILGPFEVTKPPFRRSPEPRGFIQKHFEDYQILKEMRQFAQEHYIELTNYDITLFLYFHREGGSLEYKEASRSKFFNMAFIYFPIEPESQEHHLAKVAHEIGHLLGASDKYNPLDENMSVYPGGIAEPFNEPVYPQTKAEFMSGTIPLLDARSEMIPNLKDAKIGYESGYEMNWVSDFEYRKYYDRSK